MKTYITKTLYIIRDKRIRCEKTNKIIFFSVTKIRYVGKEDLILIYLLISDLCDRIGVLRLQFSLDQTVISKTKFETESSCLSCYDLNSLSTFWCILILRLRSKLQTDDCWKFGALTGKVNQGVDLFDYSFGVTWSLFKFGTSQVRHTSSGGESGCEIDAIFGVRSEERDERVR